MIRIVFSVAARHDRRAITEYTVTQFGIHQARRLRDRLEAALHVLAKTPQLGHGRDDLDPPGHTFRYHLVFKRFLIVYDVVDDVLRVARILHGARDLTAELGNEPGEDDPEP